MSEFWVIGSKGVIMPRGIVHGAVKISGSKIGAISAKAPTRAKRISLRGAYIAPGFIDLHVWGPIEQLSHFLPKSGTTSFLRTIGPGAPKNILTQLHEIGSTRGLEGAQCLGAHLEGPFVNPTL